MQLMGIKGITRISKWDVAFNKGVWEFFFIGVVVIFLFIMLFLVLFWIDPDYAWLVW